MQYLATRSRVLGLSMEIFILCDFEFGWNCGVASDKTNFYFLVCFYIDSLDVVGDAVDGECVEANDIFILGSLILSLFISRESLSLLGLLIHIMPLFSFCPPRKH